MFAGDPAGFLGRERAQVEMGGRGQLLVVGEPGLQIRFPGLRYVTLAMGGARLVKRGDRGLGGVGARILLAGGREAVARLVEFALGIGAQAGRTASAGLSARMFPASDAASTIAVTACGTGWRAARAGRPRRRDELESRLGRLDRARVETRERIGQ